MVIITSQTKIILGRLDNLKTRSVVGGRDGELVPRPQGQMTQVLAKVPACTVTLHYTQDFPAAFFLPDEGDGVYLVSEGQKVTSLV